MSVKSAGNHEASQSPLALLPDVLELPPITSVKQKVTFDYYGLVGSSFLDSAAACLAAQTDAPFQSASRTIKSFFETTYTDCVGSMEGKSACWLTIRFSRPNDMFSIPRWHQDRRMYPYDEGRENIPRSKYGVTMVGPPTLIFEFTSPQSVATEREGFEKHIRQNAPKTGEERNRAEEQLRLWLAEQFRGQKLLELKPGQIIRFTWGRDDSPMHSEPDIVSDRVFMTVLFGSEKEIRAMAEWRSEPFGEPTIE